MNYLVHFATAPSAGVKPTFISSPNKLATSGFELYENFCKSPVHQAPQDVNA